MTALELWQPYINNSMLNRIAADIYPKNFFHSSNWKNNFEFIRVKNRIVNRNCFNNRDHNKSNESEKGTK